MVNNDQQVKPTRLATENTMVFGVKTIGVPRTMTEIDELRTRRYCFMHLRLHCKSQRELQLRLTSRWRAKSVTESITASVRRQRQTSSRYEHCQKP
jgi:hypothetical protein